MGQHFAASIAGIAILLGACSNLNDVRRSEAPAYCGGGGIQRVIQYASDGRRQESVVVWIREENKKTGAVSEREVQGITAYSWFGSNQPVPKGFVKALLLNSGGEMLVFEDGNERWIEFGDYTYRECS